MSSAGEAGVSSGALTMIEQPVASEADTLRTTWLIGKFHGVKAATGPTGTLFAICATPIERAEMMAIAAPGLFGEPVDRVGAGKHFRLRMSQRFALFAAHHIGAGIGALAQNVGRLAHQLVAR